MKKVQFLKWGMAILGINLVAQTFAFAQEPTPRLTLGGHTGWIRTVVFSPDGKTLASHGVNDGVKLWDVATGKELASLPGECPVFTPDGKLLICGGKEINLFRLPGRVAFANIPTRTMQQAVSPDGRTLATSADSIGPVPVAITLFEIASGKPRLTLADHPILSLAFSSDGKWLAAGAYGRNENVKLWDTTNGQNVASFPQESDIPPGPCVLARMAKPWRNPGETRDEVSLWEVPNSKLLQKLTIAQVTSLAFSPDGKHLAAGRKAREKNILLWDVAKDQESLTTRGRMSDVWSIAFSPDGKTLASGHWDRTIKLWDIPPGK